MMTKFFCVTLLSSFIMVQLIVTSSAVPVQIEEAQAVISTGVNELPADSKLDLAARHKVLLEFEKHFAQFSCEAIKVILVDLKAAPEHIVAHDDKITALKNALDKIKKINLINEPLDPLEVRAATNIIGELISQTNINLVSAVKEHGQLAFELQRFNFFLGEAFDDLIATLTPEERELDAGLVSLHKQYNESDNDEKWQFWIKLWNYFE
ncbi:PREDICTED: uncharacterized protein LOC108967843 [Bactrocera latifrons]|uniref:uncharacterized protein LOC108967843 n=1 Tax=Bactrocera latifrons TaxID=174628 RepID=UPI0008DE9B6F|nr:PREDICTED: uncharacterized protein LOC108967843 [Bactrocera latifrons]